MRTSYCSTVARLSQVQISWQSHFSSNLLPLYSTGIDGRVTKVYGVLQFGAAVLPIAMRVDVLVLEAGDSILRLVLSQWQR
jgi:hypothetical protein